MSSEKQGPLDLFRDRYRSGDYWNYDSANGPVLYGVYNLEKQATVGHRGSAVQARSSSRARVLVDRSGTGKCLCDDRQGSRCAVEIPWHHDRSNVALTSTINLYAFFDRADLDNGCIETVPDLHLSPDDADVEGARRRGRGIRRKGG